MELKFVDYEKTGDAFTTSWASGEMNPTTPLCISAVAQGDGENQRDGRKYLLHSVHMRGKVQVSTSESGAGPPADVICRLLIVQDTQTNASELNAEDVMLVNATASSVYSMRNLQEVTRFKILWDKRIRIPVSAASMNEGAINLFANANVSIPFSFDYNFTTPVGVNCVGTTATVAAISDNSIHVIGVASSALVTLEYKTRIRFTG